MVVGVDRKPYGCALRRALIVGKKLFALVALPVFNVSFRDACGRLCFVVRGHTVKIMSLRRKRNRCCELLRAFLVREDFPALVVIRITAAHPIFFIARFRTGGFLFGEILLVRDASVGGEREHDQIVIVGAASFPVVCRGRDRRVAGIRVSKCPRFVIPIPYLPARAARCIALERNIEIYLDLSVCVPVRKVDAVDTDIRYASGMSRLAALILACGQRKCNAGQRIIELIRHRLAAVHADHVLPGQLERIHRIVKTFFVLGFAVFALILGLVLRLFRIFGLLRGVLFRRFFLFFEFFLFFGFLLFEGLLVLRFRFVRILIQRAVVQMRALCAADRAVRVPAVFRAGGIADADESFVPRILRQNRNRQHTQHHTAKQHQAEQSFFHRVLPFLSRSSVPRERACQRSVACGYHPHAREYSLGFLFQTRLGQIAERKFVAHGERLKQDVHDPLRDRADIPPRDIRQRLLDLLLRHAVGAQAHRQKQLDLPLERQRFIARLRHIRAHDARRAELHRVKIGRREPRLVRAENLLDLLGRLAEDILGRFLLRIGLKINFPQILVELCERHLNGCLDRVDIDGRQRLPRRLARHGKLVAEHELDELCQNAVLGAENILKRAVGNARLVDDLCDRRLLVSLLQKELDADRQDALFRWQARACDCDRITPLPRISSCLACMPRLYQTGKKKAREQKNFTPLDKRTHARYIS